MIKSGTNIGEITLDMLGLSPWHRKIYQEIIDYPTGLVIVTGPTGCGKTTTLYASLNYLKNKNKKIITVENPVEHTITGIIQAHYKSGIGLTYEVFLKAMLRQDPDVLMVGEMRDRTAIEATIQTALTGHKVFAASNEKSAVQALYGMVDMGIETFLIFSTVKAIIAQRLVRRVCSECLVEYEPSREILDKFLPIETMDKFLAFDMTDDLKNRKFKKGAGCEKCKQTGWAMDANGNFLRTGLFEIMMMNDNIRDALIGHKTSNEIESMCSKCGQIMLMEDGFYKALQAVTTLEEVVSEIENSTPVSNETEEKIRARIGQLSEEFDHINHKAEKEITEIKKEQVLERARLKDLIKEQYRKLGIGPELSNKCDHPKCLIRCDSIKNQVVCDVCEKMIGIPDGSWRKSG